MADPPDQGQLVSARSRQWVVNDVRPGLEANPERVAIVQPVEPVRQEPQRLPVKTLFEG